jgi:hypothetical protein
MEPPRRPRAHLPAFAVAILLVFLVLAAQYESWTLPFSVLLSTPIAVAGAFAALRCTLGKHVLDYALTGTSDGSTISIAAGGLGLNDPRVAAADAALKQDFNPFTVKRASPIKTPNL